MVIFFTHLKQVCLFLSDMDVTFMSMIVVFVLFFCKYIKILFWYFESSIRKYIHLV